MGGVGPIFTDVDDFLIVYDTSEKLDESWAVVKWREIFLSCSGCLSFTVESHDGGVIWFLDRKLMSSASHACWGYEPRSHKALPPFNSAHSKLVKNGIAPSCLLAVLRKILPSSDARAFSSRFMVAGFSPIFIASVAERLKKIRTYIAYTAYIAYPIT